MEGKRVSSIEKNYVKIVLLFHITLCCAALSVLLSISKNLIDHMVYHMLTKSKQKH